MRQGNLVNQGNNLCILMHLSPRCICWWIGEGAAAHTSHQQWTKQSSLERTRTPAPRSRNVSATERMTRRSVSLKWLWHAGCTVWRSHTQYLLSPCVSSCSVLLYIYPSLLFYPSLIAHLFFCPSFYPSSSCSLNSLLTILQLTHVTDLYQPLINPCTLELRVVLFWMSMCVCVCAELLVTSQGKNHLHYTTHKHTHKNTHTQIEITDNLCKCINSHMQTHTFTKV